MGDQKKLLIKFSLTSGFIYKLYASIVLFLLYMIYVFSPACYSFHFPLTSPGLKFNLIQASI